MIWSDQGLAVLSFTPVSVTIILLSTTDSTYLVPVCTRSMHGQLHFWIAVVPVHCGVTIVAIQASLTSKVKIDTLKSKPLYLVPIFSYLQ